MGKLFRTEMLKTSHPRHCIFSHNRLFLWWRESLGTVVRQFHQGFVQCYLLSVSCLTGAESKISSVCSIMATKTSAKAVFTLTVAAMLDMIFVQVGYFALILENISNSLADLALTKPNLRSPLSSSFKLFRQPRSNTWKSPRWTWPFFYDRNVVLWPNIKETDCERNDFPFKF